MVKQSKRDREDETVKWVGDKEIFIDFEDSMELAALELGGRAFQLLQNKVPKLSVETLDNFRKESIRHRPHCRVTCRGRADGSESGTACSGSEGAQ